MSTIGKSSNILWHECSFNKADREELLNQKGCVIWITGLSGSGLFIRSFLCFICLLIHSYTIFVSGCCVVGALHNNIQIMELPLVIV